MTLPPIDQATLPADIRKGSAADKKTYTAALGFERMLLGELTKAMTATAQPVDGSGSGDAGSSDDSTSTDETSQSTDAASQMYMQMLPDQLADSITENGGLGLARSFYDSLKEKS